MRFYRHAVWTGWTEVLWHPLSRGLLALTVPLLAGASVWFYDEARGLVGRQGQNLAVEILAESVLEPVQKALFLLQLLLVLPIVGVERFRGALDAIWTRPVSRSGYLLARVVGRSFFYPLLLSLLLAGLGVGLWQAGLPLAPLAPLAGRGLLFGWLSSLTASTLLVALGCLATTRLMHGVYWALAYVAQQQLTVFITNTGGSGPWTGPLKVFWSFWTALVLGAPGTWIATSFLSSWHLARTLASFAFGLGSNILLLAALCRRAEVFHD